MRRAASPFLEIAESEWLCAKTLAFAVFDSFAVSPGHVLVVTRRVVPTFFECSADEQAAVMALVGDDLRITSPDALRQLLGWIEITEEKGGWLGGSGVNQWRKATDT